MMNEENMYRKVYDLVLEGMPDPPEFEAIKAHNIRVGNSRIQPIWTFVGAAAAVFVLIGGMALLFGGGGADPAGPLVSVEHLVVTYSQQISATCTGGEAMETGEFDEFTIEVWIDQAGDRRRAVVLYPDGREVSVVGLGEPLNSVYGRGESLSRQVLCRFGADTSNQPGVWDDPINLASWGFGVGPYFGVQPEELVDGDALDSLGRRAVLYRGSVSGFAVYNDSDQRPLTQTSERYVDTGGDILEWSWTETVTNTFELVQRLTVVQRETIEVDASILDTTPLEKIFEADPTVTTTPGTATTEIGTVPPTTSPPESDFGPEQLLAGLADQGIDASLAPWPFSRSGFLPQVSDYHVVCLPSGQASLFEYDTVELREADSDLIQSDGGFDEGHFDLLYGRTMWWAKGRVIINYNFANLEYWKALTVVLGETLSPDGEFYGDPPDPLPPSEPCF